MPTIELIPTPQPLTDPESGATVATTHHRIKVNGRAVGPMLPLGEAVVVKDWLEASWKSINLRLGKLS